MNSSSGLTILPLLLLAFAGSVIVVQRQSQRSADYLIGMLRAESMAKRPLAEKNAALLKQLAAAEARLATINELRDSGGLSGLPEAGEPTPNRGEKKNVLLAAGLVAATDLKNAGRGNGRDAFETIAWAVNGGDTALLASAIQIPDAARPLAEKAFNQLSPEKQQEFGSVDRMLSVLLAPSTE